MSITLTMGWWVLPAILTLVSFVIAIAATWPDRQGTNSLIGGLVYIIMFGAATIVSLVGWLLWAVLT